MVVEIVSAYSSSWLFVGYLDSEMVFSLSSTLDNSCSKSLVHSSGSILPMRNFLGKNSVISFKP